MRRERALMHNQAAHEPEAPRLSQLYLHWASPVHSGAAGHETSKRAISFFSAEVRILVFPAMPIRIRMALHGCTNRPFFHIVVAHSRAPRNGRHIEQVSCSNNAGHVGILLVGVVFRICLWNLHKNYALVCLHLFTGNI